MGPLGMSSRTGYVLTVTIDCRSLGVRRKPVGDQLKSILAVAQWSFAFGKQMQSVGDGLEFTKLSGNWTTKKIIAFQIGRSQAVFSWSQKSQMFERKMEEKA